MDPADVVYESTPSCRRSASRPPGTTLQHSALSTEVTPLRSFRTCTTRHALNTHLTVSGETKVIHDGAYDFEEQRQYPIDLLQFKPGDTIATECTFENPGTRNVTFGESSDTEMCFSVLFRFPNTGSAFCVGAR